MARRASNDSAARGEGPQAGKRAGALGLKEETGRADVSRRPLQVEGEQEGASRPVRSITPPSIPALVSSELRRRIASGQLQPGPLKISDLAQEFGVSAVPVREALRMLEMEGLVTFDHNRSVHVNALSLDDLREVYDIRMVLEPLLLGRAVPRLRSDKSRLKRLEELIRAMDDSSDIAAWSDMNTAFHWECYEASEMRRLKSIVSSLWTSVEPFMRLYATSAGGTELSQREHRELLKYIKSGNVAKVEDATRHHLRDTLQAIEARMQGLGAAS